MQMTDPKKILLRLSVGVVLALLLFFGALLLLPRLIHLEAVKTWIETAVSERTGGTVRYREAEIRFLPRPVILLRNTTLVFGGTATGTVDTVALSPELLPLIRGEIRVGSVRLEKPDFRMPLPAFPLAATRSPWTLAQIRGRARRFLAAIGSIATNLVMTVEEGSLSLYPPRGAPITFRGIRAKADFPPGTLRVDLGCSSSLWEGLSVTGSIDAGDLRLTGRLALRQFRPVPLEEYLFPGAPRGFAGEITELDMTFRSGGMQSLEAEGKMASPFLEVRRGGRRFSFAGVRARGFVRVDDERVAATLEELRVDAPRLVLSGNVTVNRPSPGVVLSLQGKDLDVRSIRATALALADDLPAVRDVFFVLRSGEVPSLDVEGHGGTVADMTRIGNLVIHGEIREGDLYVPGPELHLVEARGKATVAKGILTAENAEARVGGSRCRGGNLTLGLVGTDRPFRLATGVETDLVELPPLLTRLVENGVFRKELSLLQEVRGSASGRLVLEGTTGSFRTNVDVTGFHIVSRYRRIPFPVEIRGGHFSYDDGDIRAADLSGSVGNSSFSRLEGRLRTDGVPRIEDLSGDLRIDAGEVYPWISSWGEIRETLDGIRSARGTVSLSLSHLEGPLRNPGGWRFGASGGVTDLVVESSRLPGSVAVPRGTFRAREGALSVPGARVDFLDSSLSVSGSFAGTSGHLEEAAGTGNGRLGPDALHWIAEAVHLPRELRPRPPLVLTDSSVSWKTKEGTTVFQGDFVFPDGPTATVDLWKSRESLALRRLDIRDGKSLASLSVELGNDQILLAFSGSLTGKTLEKVFSDNAQSLGEVSGDFRALILPREPVRSTTEGTLEGKNITVPWRRAIPLRFDKVSLEATGSQVKVKSTVLRLGDHSFLLHGDIRASDEGWHLDMDASTDKIDWDRLKILFADEGRKEQVPSGPAGFAAGESGTSFTRAGRFLGLPVRGALRLSTGSLVFRNTAWEPFRAEIFLRREETDVRVVEAARCGISFPGNLSAVPGGLALDFRPAVRDGDLARTLLCLGEDRIRATGTFGLEATIEGRGSGEALARSLHGNVTVDARNGRIYRMTLLSKVFALLNITEVFRGKVPDLAREGFSYDTMKGKGTIREGRLVLEEMVIKGPSLEMFAHGNVDLATGRGDLELLLAPFRTVDSIIQRIPLLRYILGGTLVSIPVKVTGNLGDPDVTPLPPEEIGSGVLGVIRRTLTVPFKVIQPLLPSKKGKDGG
jgi:hypothetical protein